MPLLLRALIAVLCLAPQLASGSAHAAVFYPESFTLDNGLRIIVVSNRLSPAVAQMVWYKVGSSDEVAGKSGLAHYLEHLMFRGTKDVSPGQFSARIAAQGGNDNAFTSFDFTAYHEIVAADRLGMIMQLEADRMSNLAIEAKTATPELGVVLDERHERTDNDPAGKFGEDVRAILFPKHPYGTPVIGWRSEVEKMSAADADDFYRRHYAPNNAVVVISGNTDLAEVKKLAVDTYAKVPMGRIADRTPIVMPDAPKQKRLERKDGRVEQPEILFQILAPSYITQKNNEAYALEVLAEVLGGEIGPLYKSLVVEKKIASSVDVEYDPRSRGPAIFAIAATPQTGTDPRKLEKAMQDELQKLAKQGFDEKKIVEAWGRLERSATFARDSLLAPGYAFGMALTTGQTIENVEDWPVNIHRSAEEVNKAFRALMADPHRVDALLLPDPNAPVSKPVEPHLGGGGVGIR